MNEIREQLQHRKDLLFAELKYLNDTVKAASVPKLTLLKSKYSKLEGLTVTFKQLFDEIVLYNARVDISQEIPLEDQISFIELIEAVRKTFAEAEEEKFKESTPFTAGESNFPNNLLPVFDGTPEKWAEFKQIFDTLVHFNNNLSDERKLLYLKTCLRGEAAATIWGFAISKENYFPAYETLLRRYQSLRHLATTYIQSILRYNFGCYNLQRFVPYHEGAVDALKALCLPDLSDFLLFQLCYNNLDAHIQKQFDLKHKEHVKIPTAADLFSYVTAVVKSMQAKEEAEAQNAQNAESAQNAQNAQNDPGQSEPTPIVTQDSTPEPTREVKLEKSGVKLCSFCQETHFIAFCQEFRNNSVEKRLEFVIHHKLCTNCLGPHDLMFCWSKKTCHACNQKHHTLLHALLVSFYYAPAIGDMSYDAVCGYRNWTVIN